MGTRQGRIEHGQIMTAAERRGRSGVGESMLRPPVEPTEDRIEWAAHYAKIVEANLARGQYPQAIAAIQRAQREDPRSRPPLADMTMADRLDLPLGDLLTIRTRNALEEHGIFTVGDLLQMTSNDVLSVSGISHGVFAEIDRMLPKLGLKRRHAG